MTTSDNVDRPSNPKTLSPNARVWLNELRRKSGGYSATVLAHINAQAEEIARVKTPDLTAADMDAAVRTIAGSARSMGITVEGVK